MRGEVCLLYNDTHSTRCVLRWIALQIRDKNQGKATVVN